MRGPDGYVNGAELGMSSYQDNTLFIIYEEDDGINREIAKRMTFIFETTVALD